MFLFLRDEPTATFPNPVELSESANNAAATTRLRREDARYLHPEALAALPSGERTARDLQTLLKIATAIGSIRNVESLQWQLLGMIFDVVPAERGAILAGTDPEEFSSVVAWDRVAGPQHPVHVDRDLARQVFQERIGILSNDPSETPRTPPVHSLICVPLLNLDKAVGLIYLDTANPVVRFTDDDLQLVTAVAGVAAMAMESARQVEWLGSENLRLRAEVNLDHDMVGDSAEMREIYQLIERVAATPSTVLIYGESGTGKELAARAIHRNSARRDQAFVAIICAALTGTLLESDFSATNAAHSPAPSARNAASSKWPTPARSSSTRWARSARACKRNFARPAGARIHACRRHALHAAEYPRHRRHQQESPEGHQGWHLPRRLYYRLNVVSITMPALRDHKEDIPLLAGYFAAKYAERCNRRILGISPDAGALLSQYHWPGNIRELENAVERAVVLGSSGMILPEDLPETLHERPHNRCAHRHITKRSAS